MIATSRVATLVTNFRVGINNELDRVRPLWMIEVLRSKQLEERSEDKACIAMGEQRALLLKEALRTHTITPDGKRLVRCMHSHHAYKKLSLVALLVRLVQAAGDSLAAQRACAEEKQVEERSIPGAKLANSSPGLRVC